MRECDARRNVYVQRTEVGDYEFLDPRPKDQPEPRDG